MFLGLGLATISGLLDVSMALPLQLARRWRWENIWGLYSLLGMFCFPWVLSYFFLANPLTFYTNARIGDLLPPFWFGAGWGVGSILFGLGVTRVGLGLGYGIVVSLTAVNGVLLPLILLHPEQVGTFQRRILFVALAVLIVGVGLSSAAGARRASEKPLLLRERPDLVVGLVCCVLSGLFSPMLNFAYAFASPLTQAALSSGVGEIGASVAVLALAMFPAFVVSAAYCMYLLTKHRSWQDFVVPQAASHWLYALLMGFCQMGAFLVYGVSIIYLGSTGPIFGWPVYMATVILASNFWGLGRGEWQGSDRRTYGYLFLGIICVVAAVLFVSLAQASIVAA